MNDFNSVCESFMAKVFGNNMDRFSHKINTSEL